MALVKFNHRFSPVFSDTWNDFFNKDFTQLMGHEGGNNWAKVNVVELDKGYRIEVAAPGLSKEDFELKVDGDVLTIKAKREANTPQEGEKYTRREFSFHSFQRSFTLPDTVDTANVEARYVDGILHVSLAKKEEAVVAPARVIDIQ